MHVFEFSFATIYLLNIIWDYLLKNFKILFNVIELGLNKLFFILRRKILLNMKFLNIYWVNSHFDSHITKKFHFDLLKEKKNYKMISKLTLWHSSHSFCYLTLTIWVTWHISYCFICSIIYWFIYFILCKKFVNLIYFIR